MRCLVCYSILSVLAATYSILNARRTRILPVSNKQHFIIAYDLRPQKYGVTL
jgi:hypothetical protein